MCDHSNSVEAEALKILDYLAATAFKNCIPLSKEFQELPMSAGIYAVKHCMLGILYIGKTRTLRDRFRGGHKALLWAFIEELSPRDVAIVVHPLNFDQWVRLSSQLETIILRASEPPYNVRIPARE